MKKKEKKDCRKGHIIIWIISTNKEGKDKKYFECRNCKERFLKVDKYEVY